jgi:hypothetical protein
MRVARHILGLARVRIVRRPEVHHDEERPVFPARFPRERDGFVDDQFRAFTRHDHRRRTVAAERWVHLEEIVVRQVLVETHAPGIEGRFLLHRADMPLAEMRRAVARPLENMTDRDFLRPRRPVRRKRPGTIRVPTGEHARARRRAHRRRRVETIQPQRRARHLIEHRRLDVRVAVVAGFTPPLIIGHQQNDIRPVVARSGRARVAAEGDGGENEEGA